jgi:hypothetical protein
MNAADMTHEKASITLDDFGFADIGVGILPGLKCCPAPRCRPLSVAARERLRRASNLTIDHARM